MSSDEVRGDQPAQRQPGPEDLALGSALVKAEASLSDDGAPLSTTLGPPVGPPSKPVYFVGIGGSTGGADACSKLLEYLPENTGMVFVCGLGHQPDGHDQLGERLARATKMPVLQARHQMAVKVDHVYVIPPNTTMLLAEGQFDFASRVPRGLHMPIDTLFRSLALDQRSRVIGVVLSGDGSDGALGLRAIKAEGGITIAQAPETAQIDSMPRHAIATDCVDLVKPVEEIATEIAALGQQLRDAYQRAPESDKSDREDDLKKIFTLLRATQNVDFTLYRHTTIKRRILRRMVLYRVQSVKEYIQYLQDSPVELEALYQDILIKVTHFFRDPEVFNALKEHVYPSLLKARTGDGPLRLWVPGCSTGEEAYSFAISMIEVLSELRLNVPLQIFATDVSDAALERARAGVYLENIAVDVSTERLRRFFNKVGNHYQISKAVRDACIFAKQNVIRDPPFSKLDMISCRNVLIYFEPILQKNVLPMFHYALKPTGFLLLGSSETVGHFSDLFTVVDKKNKLYAKASVASYPHFDLAGPRHGFDNETSERMMQKPNDGTPGRVDVLKEADKVIMGRYAPSGVIINGDLQIVQFRGRTGSFLEPAPGEASLNVLKMAREGLLFELRTAIHKAKRTDAAVRTERLRIREGNQLRDVTVEVIPLREGRDGESQAIADRCFLIVFEEPVQKPAVAKGKPATPEKSKRGAKTTRELQITQLEQELTATKEYLQAIIEEQEATNEELQSANEELLSSNEELQSINEELETAKEELQSTNEELSTVNEELENRNGELSRLTDDLGNLLASVNIPIVMLTSDLRIRRFTPQAERVLNVIQGDLGRSIGDIKPRINVPDLERLIAEVIDSSSIHEREVQDHEGRWYSLRIRPYRTAENRIEGAVICLVDIDELKRSIDEKVQRQKTSGSQG